MVMTSRPRDGADDRKDRFCSLDSEKGERGGIGEGKRQRREEPARPQTVPATHCRIPIQPHTIDTNDYAFVKG